MKNLFKKGILLIFVAILININGKSQNTIYNDCNSYENPVFLLKGETITNQCDTAVLINTLRWRLYEKARKTILFTNYNEYEELFNNYDSLIFIYKKWNDSLQLKYTDINTLFERSLVDTKKDLKKINIDLFAAKDSLSSANNNLNQAIKHLNNARLEKLKNMGIGFSIGIAVFGVLYLFAH
jgi:hypothetical protein